MTRALDVDLQMHLRSIEANPMFRAEIQAAHRHVRFTFDGFWDEETVGWFDEAVEATVRAMNRSGIAYGRFRTLIDVRGAQLLSQTVAERVAMLAAKHAPASDRIAILAGSTLQKIQYQRVAAQREFQHFVSAREAINCLTAH